MISSIKAGNKDQQIVLLFIVILNLVHFITLDYYDFSKDEYYKMALSHRPDWGYLGTMPFSVWMVGIITDVFGNELVFLRSAPALLCFATCLIIVRIVEELGGDLWAKLIAITAFLNAPVVVGTFHIYSQNPIDVFIWSWAILRLIRFEKSNRPADWYWLMVCLGIGLMNRLTILWFGFTLFLGLLFFNRDWLKTYHFWLGGLIPLAFFAPIINWQASHGFAHFNYIVSSSEGHISILQFWINQILIHNPLNLLIWGAGLLWLVIGFKRPYQALAIIAFGSFIIVSWLGREKPYNFYYATPIYAILYPLGALAVSKHLPSLVRVKKVILGVLFVSSLITSLAFFTPLSVASYQRLVTDESIASVVDAFGMQSKVPPQISNQYGWRSINQSFNEVLKQLEEKDKKDFTIWANHYSIASAIEILNPDLTQQVISNSESYWMFGHPPDEQHFLIICNRENSFLEIFDRVALLHTHQCSECPKWRRKIYFYWAEHPTDLNAFWSENLKN